MADRIIRTMNTPGRTEDGFRVLQGQQEYVTYLEDSCFRLWYSDIPWRYEAHFHSAVEIVLTLKGNVEYEVEGKRYDVGENDIILIPPGLIHSLNMGEGSSRYLCLFEPEAIYGMPDIKRFFSDYQHVFFLNDGSPVHGEIRELLLQAVAVYEEQDMMWNAVCYSCMMRIYALVAQHFLAGTVSASAARKRSTDSEIITSSMVYINNHYKEDLSLDRVADFVGFSRYYFSRSFKKQTGYSFKDYLCQKRLQVAMDLLIHTNRSMREVAEESGFGSVATFNRVFRDSKNCTPTQYRAIYGRY